MVEDVQPVVICWKGKFHVAIKMCIAVSCDSFAEAVVNFVGVLSAMNCHYSKKGCNTYNFIQQILLTISGGKLPPKVLSVRESC